MNLVLLSLVAASTAAAAAAVGSSATNVNTDTATVSVQEGPGAGVSTGAGGGGAVNLLSESELSSGCLGFPSDNFIHARWVLRTYIALVSPRAWRWLALGRQGRKPLKNGSTYTIGPLLLLLLLLLCTAASKMHV